MNLLKSSVAVLAFAVIVPNAFAQTITGAGATFPAPLYAKWAEAYKAKAGKAVNYQPIGSGGGIKQITAKTVDFGASDDPMTPAELDQNGLLQFPAAIGGVVLVVNLPGVQPGQLKLNGKVAGDIFSGTIKTWNDPAIVALNPGVSLAATAITPVYRSDSSGTTAVFTDYLAQVNPDYKAKVGAGKTVNWPAGVGGRGNAGVAASVAKVAGSIGYVEFAFAKQGKLTHTALINRNGKVVQPDDLTFAAAADGAKWDATPGFGISLNNQAKDNAWPITSATFILLQRNGDAAKNSEVLKFFAWSMQNGKAMAEELDYVALPAPLVKLVESSWAQLKDASGKPLAFR